MPFNPEAISRQIRSISDFLEERGKTQADLRTALKKKYISTQVEQAFPDPLKQLKQKLELQKIGEEIGGLKRKAEMHKGSMEELMRYGRIPPSKEFLQKHTRPTGRWGIRRGGEPIELPAGVVRTPSSGRMFPKTIEEVVQPARTRAEAMGVQPVMKKFGEFGLEKIKPEKEKVPSWAQEQKIASVKAGLRRGSGIVTKEWGELAEEPVKSYADVMRIIQFNKLDPANFTEELAFYKNIVQTGKAPDGRIVAKMKNGKMIYLDTREEITE